MVTNQQLSSSSTVERKVRAFVSYSHEDAIWMRRLLPVLKVKAGVQNVQAWHDAEIQAGGRWDDEIRAELSQMDVFFCLVSFEFLASDYIQTVELPMAQTRHAKGEIEVVPILLWQMDLKEDCPFLHQFNPLPKWGEYWGQYSEFNAALYKIGNGVKQAITNVQKRIGRCC